jgi:UDP-glucuronate decarboxylase
MNTGIKSAPDLLKEDAARVVQCFDFRWLKGKTVMITGASGLIGINFLASLWEISEKIEGLRIIPVIQPEPPGFLVPYLSGKGTLTYTGDLTDDQFLSSLPMADLIIHAAGFGQPRRFMADPIGALKLNTYTTFRLFDKLNTEGRFLFMSSSEIYNGLLPQKYSEEQIGTTNPFNPRACYIEGKRTGETICNLYHEKGVSAYSIRLSLTYGPGTGKGDQRVLPSLIEKGLSGRIELVDSGNAGRTFCYISDAIELMWHIILNGKRNLYNIGGFSSLTIKELAYSIAKILDVPVIFPERESSIPGAPDNVSLDMSRILTEYPKHDFLDLGEGLKRTIEWYKLIS